jgi:protein-disulfide isomerase
MLFARFGKPLAAAFALWLVAAPSTAGAFSDADKAEIGDVVRAYILDHPEIIQEALQALDAKQKANAAKAQTEALASLHDDVFNAPLQAVIGNPDGKVTLVEFIDYNCGYCKRALGDTRAMLDSEKDVRIVLKEFPILSAGSVEAARVASAVTIVDPVKYQAFHFELLGGRGQADEARALAAAETVGVDVAAVKKTMDEARINETIQANYAVAQKLGISGTPTYVIGDEVVFGAVGADELKEKIASMRACGKTAC